MTKNIVGNSEVAQLRNSSKTRIIYLKYSTVHQHHAHCPMRKYGSVPLKNSNETVSLLAAKWFAQHTKCKIELCRAYL